MDSEEEKIPIPGVYSTGSVYHTESRFKAELLAHESQIELAYQRRAQSDFLCFIRGLVIASARPRVFESVMADFQRVFFEDIASSLQALQAGDDPPRKRWWMERTKKASKDADLAAILLWVIAFAKRPIYGQVGAADRDQASIVKERISVLLHLNPWLNKHVEMVQWEVRSVAKMASGHRLARLDIMSSDIAGAHGGTPDILVVNELSHVNKWEFAENLMDNADGVPQGMAIVATNAGFRGTKAEVWRNNAIRSESWTAHILDRPAPWHNWHAIQDARKRNTPSRFKRLWQGKWVSGKGDALDEEDVNKVFSVRHPVLRPEPGWDYLIGLDLGITHDHCGMAVVGVNEKERKIRCGWFRRWEPPEEGEIYLPDVEDSVYASWQTYRPICVLYDPHQAKLMAQRLEHKGVVMKEMTFSSSTNITTMAECLMQVVENGTLECWDDLDGSLRRDFGKFNIVEKSYGYKLEAVSDEFGHADVGTALVICLPAAVDMLRGVRGLRPDDVLVEENDAPLTEKEMKELPDEFKELYEMEEDVEPPDVDPFGDIE